MSETSKSKDKTMTRWVLITLALFAAIFGGDMMYDRQAPDKAAALCGKDKVKSISTKGLYKIGIECEKTGAG